MEPGPIEPQKAEPIRVRYAGYETPLREITLLPADVSDINKINNGLSTAEYLDSDHETTAETITWLNNIDRKRSFSRLQAVEGQENIVGVEKPISTPAPDMIVGRTSELGELSAYVYAYDHSSPIVDKIPTPDGTSRKELSFVTDKSDVERSTVEIAEAMQQTAMMMWETQAGKTVPEFTGSFTPTQLEQAKKLQIYASASGRENEAVYRQGLIDAGFKELGTYPYDDYEEHVYALDLDTLVATMAAKKAAVAQ